MTPLQGDPTIAHPRDQRHTGNGKLQLCPEYRHIDGSTSTGEREIALEDVRSLSEAEVARKLYPTTSMGRQHKMPDYEYVHQKMQKSGVTLSLLWVEYCDQCRANGKLPYPSTQFNKYYADFVHKTKATMRLEHKPSETMQVDWAGPTAHIVDTDTGEQLDTYLFVVVLPYSCYAYTEAFLDMKQEA